MHAPESNPPARTTSTRTSLLRDVRPFEPLYDRYSSQAFALAVRSRGAAMPPRRPPKTRGAGGRGRNQQFNRTRTRKW
jgi:hypothetical protein